MAFEPITRQEQIIAGKDLEPITRMEMFLKQYGGGSGGADWNAAEGEAGHVLNRTHYAESILDIAWDGDMTGRTTLDLTAVGWTGGYIAKVSDLTPTTDELIDSKIYKSDGFECTITADDIKANMFPGARAILPMRGAGTYLIGVVIDSAETTESAIGLPSGTLENGVYFTTFPETGNYVSSLEKDTFVKKIPEKYLPEIPYFDLVAMGLPNLTMDGVPAEAPVDCSEIIAALNKGSVKLHFVVDYGQPLEMNIVCSGLNIPGMIDYVTGGTFVLRINGTFLPIAISFNFSEYVSDFDGGGMSGLALPLQPMSMT